MSTIKISIHNIIKLAATIFNNKKCEQKCQKRNKHHQLKEKNNIQDQIFIKERGRRGKNFKTKMKTKGKKNSRRRQIAFLQEIRHTFRIISSRLLREEYSSNASRILEISNVVRTECPGKLDIPKETV